MAIAYLLSSDDQGLDRAVAALRRVAAGSPEEVRAWSDLSAALYMRAQRQDDPMDLLAALEAADQALERRPEAPEALFNRALILERLFALEEARRAWNEYLRRSPASAWDEDAYAHLRSLAIQTSDAGRDTLGEKVALVAVKPGGTVLDSVRRDLPAARQQASLSLADWAQERRRGNLQGAESALAMAQEIGSALDQLGGDRLILDAVSAVRQAEQSGDGARLQALIEGYKAYGEGIALYRVNLIEDAMAALSRARRDLELGASPHADYASFYLACCDYYCRRYDRSLAVVTRLRRTLAGRHYPGLRGHIGWMEGLTRITTGDPQGAFESYRQSMADFSASGDLQSAVQARSLLAESLSRLGLVEESWREAYSVLRAVPILDNPKDLNRVFITAADMALLQGRPRIARAFESEALHQARRTGDTSAVSDALVWRGLILDRLGQPAPAREDLRQAKLAIVRHPDLPVRERIESDIDLIEGSMLAKSDPQRALGPLSRALRSYGATGHRFMSLLSHQTRAQVYRRLGLNAEAEEDLQAALDFYDHLGGGISGQDVLLAFLRQTGDLFDEMIAFQIADRRRPDRAFEYADHARTRILPALALRAGSGSGRFQDLLSAELDPLPLPLIQERLPAGTSLVQYSVLPDRLLLWVVGHDRFDFNEIPITRRQLERKVARLLDSRNQLEEWNQDSADLYDILVRPWIGALPETEQIVFVPDKALHGLPFAALLDHDRGRLLVQDRETWVAPSTTLFIEMEERSRALSEPAPDEPVVVVGNPSFDRSRFQDLSNLPDSEREAAQIASLYPGAQLRTKDRASRAEILRLLSTSRMLHFAGHAVLNEQNPLLNALILAPSPGGEDIGTLTAQDFYSLHLRKTRLAFLSACFSGRAGPEDAGVSILARSLFAAGVPTVVASLWEVEDRPGAELAEEFHRHLRAGDPPAAALRKAQLAMLASGNRALQAPWTWGAFQVIGAGGS